MLTVYAFQPTLLFATLLCALVAGFTLLFAIVVMPGIGTLQDREYLRAFQVMDRVIQDNQPLFIFVWVGSALALVVATVLGVGQLVGVERMILVVAAVAYLAGTQLPTVMINIPLNNSLQALNVESADAPTLKEMRQRFEPRWNRWNTIRTFFAILASALLMVLLLLL